MTAITRVASTRDPRLTDLVRIGRGEGFSTFSGRFEGTPAFIVDCGTLDDFLDQEDRSADSVAVRVFENTAMRDAYIEEMRRESPGALGSLEC